MPIPIIATAATALITKFSDNIGNIIGDLFKKNPTVTVAQKINEIFPCSNIISKRAKEIPIQNGIGGMYIKDFGNNTDAALSKIIGSTVTILQAQVIYAINEQRTFLKQWLNIEIPFPPNDSNSYKYIYNEGIMNLVGSLISSPDCGQEIIQDALYDSGLTNEVKEKITITTEPQIQNDFINKYFLQSPYLGFIGLIVLVIIIILIKKGI